MTFTPDDIPQRRFTLVRRGYEPAEVDAFLADVRVAWISALAAAAGPAARGPDDFGRLGDEVAAVLRQAHESVATLRQRAEADAALVRQNAEIEAARLRQDAEVDRREAGRTLEQARVAAEAQMAEVRRQAGAVADTAATMARRRTDEVVEAAKREAQAAVGVQRNVRNRLEGTRGDIDQALTRLVEEDEDLFAGIDLTTPPPMPPPGVDMSDLPYAEDEGEIDLRETPEPPEAETETETETDTETEASDEDPLAQMVKRAVENALRRREAGDDAEPPPEDPA
jgi:DivIVA domain-containing protein